MRHNHQSARTLQTRIPNMGRVLQCINHLSDEPTREAAPDPNRKSREPVLDLPVSDHQAHAQRLFLTPPEGCVLARRGKEDGHRSPRSHFS